MLSRETVARSNDNPKCKQSGYSSETFDFGIEPIEVIVAGNRFKNCRTLIHLGGCDILSVAPPLELGQPFRLSGVFSDETGACTLKIDDNVLVVGADNWDVESTGPRVVIRRGPGDIALSLYLEPPHRMTVERINMQYNGCYLRGGEDGLELSHDGKSWGRLYAISMENFEVGIYVG
ncbi:hypothetical protein [Pseudomonas sp. PDM13]|uniref:hypothetical protein n=1 Tax=Pseudomonas sp. PDM13 TaxID=2769255 RepID=UPI0021E0F0C1|nr:hypothetical protein [Pseudomonas sp. PDM13]MCU9949813.1 hypothetical protein [Pseudomonas sp. PDM13]